MSASGRSSGRSSASSSRASSPGASSRVLSEGTRKARVQAAKKDFNNTIMLLVGKPGNKQKGTQKVTGRFQMLLKIQAALDRVESQPGNGKGTPLALKNGTTLTRKDFNKLRDAFVSSVRQLGKIYGQAFKNKRGPQAPSKTATIAKPELVNFLVRALNENKLAPLQLAQFPLLNTNGVAIANRNMLKDLLYLYALKNNLAGLAPINRGKPPAEWAMDHMVPDNLMRETFGNELAALQARTNKDKHDRNGRVVGQSFNVEQGLPYVAWNQIVSALTRDPVDQREADMTTNTNTNAQFVAEANRERDLVRNTIKAYKASPEVAQVAQLRDQLKARAQALKKQQERQANLHVQLPM